MIKYDELINKTIIVGLTYVNEKDEIVNREVIFGKIVSVNTDSIDICIDNSKKIFSLPPDVKAIKQAEKGDYFIRSTRETIKNPDYTSKWIIHM